MPLLAIWAIKRILFPKRNPQPRRIPDPDDNGEIVAHPIIDEHPIRRLINAVLEGDTVKMVLGAAISLVCVWKIFREGGNKAQEEMGKISDEEREKMIGEIVKRLQQTELAKGQARVIELPDFLRKILFAIGIPWLGGDIAIIGSAVGIMTIGYVIGVRAGKNAENKPNQENKLKPGKKEENHRKFL